MGASLNPVSAESEWIDARPAYPPQLVEYEPGATAAVPSQGAPRDRASQRTPTKPQIPTVLIVDDEDTIAQLLGELLDSEGYRVLLARDGRAALACAQSEHPSMVLSDCMLPGMDGNQLVAALRAHPVTRTIPVALMSSTRLSKYSLPGVPFLAKPFELDDVVRLVARCTRGESRTELRGEG